MRTKLEQIIAAYESLTERLGDPAVLADQKEYARLAKEHRAQTPLAEKAREYLSAASELDSAKEMLRAETDPELKEMAADEIRDIEAVLPALEEELKVMLLPGDPNDDKDIIVEIRAGAGGDEAAIFAGDLHRMYTRFAESQRWKVEDIDSSESEAGGFKEVSFRVRGDKVYSKMKFESGVHRVQRVPATESQGRIHTSTATVAVLPEADEVDVQVNAERPEDRRLQVERTGRAVGEHDRLGRAHHAPAHRARRAVAEPEVASCRTAKRRCASCARDSTSKSSSASRPNSVRSGAARSARETGARRSAPTTSRRIA